MKNFDLFDLKDLTKDNVKEYISLITNWIKEQMTKANAKGVVLGMSGGIDCSVVGRLFQEAGYDVVLVLMPNGNSMDYAGDSNDAMDYIEKFHFKWLKAPIGNIYDTILDTIVDDKSSMTAHTIEDAPYGDSIRKEAISISNIAKANINPRIRMTILYTLAQSKGYLVAGTGNLSERIMGYFTKWGDGAFDICPIGNFTKEQVRILAKELRVPQHIIDKAPSANLWEGQTDEEEMGVTYEQIDDYIHNRNLEKNREALKKIEAQYRKSVHKLRPAPIF